MNDAMKELLFLIESLSETVRKMDDRIIELEDKDRDDSHYIVNYGEKSDYNVLQDRILGLKDRLEELDD